MELLHLAPDTLNFHCPFNISHTMPQKTLTKHLTKCPDKPANFKHCIYNLSHVMPESELKDHEENCPNRILIDIAIYQSEDMKRPDSNVEIQPSIKYEESWDGLEHTSEILKTIKTKTASMKATHNMTKSERKQHRVNLHENDINGVEILGSKDQKNKKTDAKPLFIGMRPNV